MEVKRALVVGLGSIGRRHARLLRERPNLQVEGCEPDESARNRAQSELPTMLIHRSYESALSAKPDFVVVATPHRFHCEHTLAALEVGAHVLCEKPISDRLPDAMRMKAAAERTGRVLAVGFHLHFHPGLLRTKALIAQGRLGRVLHVHCHVGSYITLTNSVSRYQERVEGALLMDYTHQPDIIYWLSGRRPCSVFMAGGRGGDLELSSNPNFLAMVCEYEEPLISTINLNYVQMPERHHYEIMGDMGWITLDINSGQLVLGRRDTRSVESEQLPSERDPIYRAEHAAFFAAAAGERRPESSADDAMVSLAVTSAAMESWRSHSRVALNWSAYS